MYHLSYFALRLDNNDDMHHFHLYKFLIKSGTFSYIPVVKVKLLFLKYLDKIFLITL